MPRVLAPYGHGRGRGTPSELDCLLHAAGQQIGLAHRAHPQRLTAHLPHRGTPLLRLLQQRQGLGNTVGKVYAQPKAEAVSGSQNRMFKIRQSSRPRSSTEMALERSLVRREKTDTEIRYDKAVWVIDRLGDANRLLHGRSPQGTLPTRQGTGLTRHGRPRKAGRTGQSAHGSDPLQETLHSSSVTPWPDDSRPEHGRPNPGIDAL